MTKTPTEFFRIMLPMFIQDKNLRIPKKFMQRFGHELSNVATLQVPNVAKTWQVKMAKMGTDLYFENGWHDFVQHHCIKEFHFLLFNYKGESGFEVVVFDKSSTEICFCQEIKKKKPESKPYHCSSIQIHENAENPSFTATMKPYNVSAKCCYLNVPVNFAKECRKLFPDYTRLRNASDGKEWRVRCTFYSVGQKIYEGWIVFVKDNALEAGDICVFELIRSDVNVVNVTITSANEA